MLRTLAILVAAVLCLPGGLCAQGGAICIYADAAGTDCNPSDTTPSDLALYVVHALTPGATASQFAAPQPGCMVGASWLSDTVVFPVTVGNSQTGVAIGYGTCLSGPIHVLTINYVTGGTTTADCPYSVIPHPDRDLVEMTDCSHAIKPATGGVSYLNSTTTCQCVELPAPPVLDYLPEGISVGHLDEKRTFDIRNRGGGTLTWTVADDQDWMSVDPASGTGEQTITVTVDRTGLPGGSYLGHIDVHSNGGNATMYSSMTVVWPPLNNELEVTPDSLFFGSLATQLDFNVAWNAGELILYEATPQDAWISVLPPGGLTGPGRSAATVEVTIDRHGLPLGSHEGRVLIETAQGDRWVWVFMDVTTLSPRVATEKTTWGRVKALYGI